MEQGLLREVVKVEKVGLMEKHQAQMTFPEDLLLCLERLSSVPGQSCTPGPRPHWGWRRSVSLFWFEICGRRNG